ncbi:hypothetical protein J6590_088117 [Homalodisca vitripennis]|nr:hypothetical protein J6590_088117 [Homalodisca vitripennis]
MTNKIDRLEHLLHSTNPDFVILTEHGLKSNVINHAKLADYTLISAYGRKEHIKGGIFIDRHNNISNKTENLEIEEYSLEMVCEVMAVKIHINKKKSLFLLGVYRPPCADLDTSLQVLTDALDSLPTQRNDTLIMGDININSLDEASRESVALNALLAGYNIRRLDLPATRISETSVSSIDMVCSNIHDRIKVVVSHTGLSDHTG